MKVSLCCICLNEEQRLPDWWESAREADHIVVVDTGSTDNSLKLLSGYQSQHHDMEVLSYAGDFRFDVARNLSFSPARDRDNIIMWIDIDEVFDAGWGDELRSLLVAPARIETLMHYGSMTYVQAKGGNRDAEWKYRVHEVLVSGSGPVYRTRFSTYHHQEQGKEYRSRYLPLLEADYHDPDTRDARTAFYLMREYCYRDSASDRNMVKDLLSAIPALGGWHQYLLFARIHAAPYLVRHSDPAWLSVVYDLAKDSSVEAKFEAGSAAFAASDYLLALHLGFAGLSADAQTNLMFSYPERALRGCQRLVFDSCVALGLTDKAIYYGTLYSFDIQRLVEQAKPA